MRSGGAGSRGRRRRPAAARPARGHRPAAGDQAHRRADDGEPLLRQLPGHAGRPGRGPAAGARRHPGRRQLHAERARVSRPPHDLHHPGEERSQPELAGQPYPVRGRAQRRLRRRRGRGAARRRPGRADGLLDRGRPALLLRARADVPAGRPLVQLLPGPDVPEPQVPHLGHGPRAHGRPALGHRRLPGGRDDLRRAHQARHRLGQLPQRAALLRAAAPGARRPRADRRPAAGAGRPVAAGRGRPGRRQQVVHRRPVPARAGRVRPAPAQDRAVLRRRGRGQAARGEHRRPGLRDLLGGEPAGHPQGRVLRRGGHQPRHEWPGVAPHAADLALRRARRLLRPRPAAGGGAARRRARAQLHPRPAPVAAHAAQPGVRWRLRPAEGHRRRSPRLRPLRLPGPGRGRLPLRPAGLRVQHRRWTTPRCSS